MYEERIVTLSAVNAEQLFHFAQPLWRHDHPDILVWYVVSVQSHLRLDLDVFVQRSLLLLDRDGLVQFVGVGDDEKGVEEEERREKHEEPERMDIRIDFSGGELLREEPGPAEQQKKRLPDLSVELVDILEVLSDIFPEWLLRVERILAAAAAIHSLKLFAAVLAVVVCRDAVPADTFEPVVFDPAHESLLTGLQSSFQPADSIGKPDLRASFGHWLFMNVESGRIRED